MRRSTHDQIMDQLARWACEGGISREEFERRRDAVWVHDAAFDLLRELKDLLDDCEGSASPVLVETARAAIKKAEQGDE